MNDLIVFFIVLIVGIVFFILWLKERRERKKIEAENEQFEKDFINWEPRKGTIEILTDYQDTSETKLLRH